jgi:hypothetical protein
VTIQHERQSQHPPRRIGITRLRRRTTQSNRI